MITLADVLASPSMSAASPLLRSGVPDTLERVVRWVHSSEVLEVAPLLRGGELLLSGGESLLALPEEKQEEYVRSLAARGIAALALQTAGPGIPLPETLVAAADRNTLPLIELRAGLHQILGRELFQYFVNRHDASLCHFLLKGVYVFSLRHTHGVSYGFCFRRSPLCPTQRES